MKRYLMTDLWIILSLLILTLVTYFNIRVTKEMIQIIYHQSMAIKSMSDAQHEIYDYLIVEEDESGE